MDKLGEPIAAYGQDIYKIKLNVFEKLMSINDLELIKKTSSFIDSLINEESEIPNKETHEAIMASINRKSYDDEELFNNVEELFNALNQE